jgi:hypothetical protein
MSRVLWKGQARRFEDWPNRNSASLPFPLGLGKNKQQIMFIDTCVHLDLNTCVCLNELEVWKKFGKKKLHFSMAIFPCIKQRIRKPNYLAILKFVESVTVVLISREYCWCDHILCMSVYSSRYGTKREMRSSSGRSRHEHEGKSKTSTTRVSELNLINNPLAASDRTVIGLLNSHRWCQIHAGIW